MASRSPGGRQIQVLLTLHDGERSFGMSLAQKSPALGAKYTVVSSVFANSPADRAGVRKGFVVRCINDKPMGGLTVAQVANHFRNVGEARITLEIVEGQVSPRTSACTAAATFGGVATLPNRPTTQGAGGDRVEQRPTAPVTGFSAVSSGRAIAAPGSALAIPRVAAPKQPVLRLGTKPAAKTLGLHPQSASASEPSADAKTVSSSRTDLKSKAVGPVLRLGPKPKPVQLEKAEGKVEVAASRVDPKPAAKSVSEKPSSAPAAVNQPASSKVLPSPVQAIDDPRSVAGAKVTPTAQPKSSPAPAAPAKVVAPVPSPPKTTPEPTVQTTAPMSAPPTPTAAGKTVVVPASLAKEAKTAVVVVPTGNTIRQSPPLPPLSAKASAAAPPTASPRITTRSGSVTQGSTVNAPARSSSVAPAETATQRTGVQTETVVREAVIQPPESAVVSARRRTPPSPVVIPSMPTADPTRSTNSAPVRSPATSTAVALSAPAPVGPVAAHAPAATKSGKKRGRRRKNPAASYGTTGSRGKDKAKKSSKHQHESNRVDAMMDDEELYAFSSGSDLEESPSKKSANGRRRGATNRTRHSLTVDRLVGMGFTQEDAEASVKEIGDDPDACMVWIISKIEERQFNEDLNRASIQSEESKRDEEKRVKTMEKETLAHATKFMALFPTSYMVCPESTASHLKKFLQSTIDRVNAEAHIREVLSKLLALEGKSIRWYKEASRSYMLELAGRLDGVLQTHEVMTCCARVSASEVNSPNGSCALVQKVLEEVKALTKALFEMPTNQGGVPPVFLECDETTKFDLDDDGFEVVE
ncbi:hypothetical protein PHYPSEUDO_013715 [Phytophthora pseudosyringae]|uniref:PDZ domain-containing protein n=1 Tax=Phytophthora pseudosyringae TaxID=221518 RepID=A0A8T1V7R8_9STRA|nr:hypothetical protein PHYPSEUDO_013715 [Phytophthora pseudosyringae]